MDEGSSAGGAFRRLRRRSVRNPARPSDRRDWSAKNYTEITGKQPEISGRQGAADTRFLNKYGDTPTVIFGPGSTAVMHANDEYVSIEDYITSIKVMALCIYDWCGAA